MTQKVPHVWVSFDALRPDKDSVQGFLSPPSSFVQKLYSPWVEMMSVSEYEERTKRLKEELELAAKTLRMARQHIVDSTKSHFDSMGKKHLAKDHIKHFGPHYITHALIKMGFEEG